jgi:hypothetical protein
MYKLPGVRLQVVPVFNFRRVDLLMRQWDVKQGRLEAALFKYRQTGQRPLANERGCLGGPKVQDAGSMHMRCCLLW